MRLTVELPETLFKRAERLVEDSLFISKDAIVIEAMTRFLDTQDCALQERFIREDMKWALEGNE